MIAEVERFKAGKMPGEMVEALEQFIETGDPSLPQQCQCRIEPWLLLNFSQLLFSAPEPTKNEWKILRFFILQSDQPGKSGGDHHEALSRVVRAMLAVAARESGPVDPARSLADLASTDARTYFEIQADRQVPPGVVEPVIAEISRLHQSLPEFIDHLLQSPTDTHPWTLAEDGTAEAPFTSPPANLIYRLIAPRHATPAQLLSCHAGLFLGLARHRPGVTECWAEQALLRAGSEWKDGLCWLAMVRVSTAYDAAFVNYCRAAAQKNAAYALPLMIHFSKARARAYDEEVTNLAAAPTATLSSRGLEVLMEHRDADLMEIMSRSFSQPLSKGGASAMDSSAFKKLYRLIPQRWEQGGRELLVNLLTNVETYPLPWVVKQFQLQPVHFPALREGIHRHLERDLEASDRLKIWKTLAEFHPAAFTEDFKEMLTAKSKPLRELAAKALKEAEGPAALPYGVTLLIAKKAEARLGGALLLEKLALPEVIPPLQAALAGETSEAVRTALHLALKAAGFTPAPEPAPDLKVGDLEDFVAKHSKGLKMPRAPWLDVTALSLNDSASTPLSPAAITYLLAKQAKHKEIAAAPDLLPLLAHIDRGTSAPFAAMLIDGFLNSEQAAADRWALTLGGLLGDNRVIPPLLARIPGWCENARHKLAEYAAQAISLLPGNEPLMVLDTLANRYRSKFKNVGKACADAFTAAAKARGITPDELGDMVVPDFGFDAGGVRAFTWQGGQASSELGADFKLTWFAPATDKIWKNLPASAPAEMQTEVKTLAKLLRETVKAQTPRLELALVRQRRWAVTRWRELYECHPLLRSFASQLVWGIYDSSGSLLRTFRRYPNGLLADAAGGLEEIPERDATVGIVHPLELSAEALTAWREHLTRFKIKPPFPQIDRPVETLDPLWGNRHEIALTKGRKISAGTFRSRAEKRGWTRGSVVDSGVVFSYWKIYPGAACEAILRLDGFWVGCDPADEIELGAAYFATAGSVERGSYAYDEPAPGDPRVLRFDAIPPVVWSETFSDLKAILGDPTTPTA